MKIEVHTHQDYIEPEVHIYCKRVDSYVTRLVERIENTSLIVIGDGELGKTTVFVENIYYFESVDKKTFIYLEKAVLESRKKLFELEEYLQNTSFVRIGKSCILNTEKVSSVAPYYGGRLEVLLESEERLLVSKKYLRSFKEKFFERME